MEKHFNYYSSFEGFFELEGLGDTDWWAGLGGSVGAAVRPVAPSGTGSTNASRGLGGGELI